MRIHLSETVSAFGPRGFAAGCNAFFAPESWNVETTEGLALLGYELAHVVQQEFLPRAAGASAGIHRLQCPVLEAQADRAGAEIARLFGAYGELPQGRGRAVLGLPDAGAVTCQGESRCLQMQEKGVLGCFSLGGPDMQPAAVAPGVVIFRQTASENEVHRTRDIFFDRAKMKNNLGSRSAQRTYYSNAFHVIPAVGHFGQGAKLCFMQDRALNPVESYGRYYDYAGPLIVEHTDDANCRLIEVTAVNMVNVSFRCWGTLGHFHMASYVGGQYAALAGTVVPRGTSYLAPFTRRAWRTDSCHGGV